MHDDELAEKVIQALLGSFSATAPEIAKILGTCESAVLPILHRLRGEDVVEFMGGHWSLSDAIRSNLAKLSVVDQ